MRTPLIKQLLTIIAVAIVQNGSAQSAFSSLNISPFNTPNFTSRVIDYDNDGDDDIIGWIAHLSNSAKLYRNNGNGTFSDVTSTYELPNYTWPTIADLDKNGYPDVYYINGDTLRFALNSGSKFSTISNYCGYYLLSKLFSTTTSGIMTIPVVWDYDNDGIFDIIAHVSDSKGSYILGVKGYINNCSNCKFFLAYDVPSILLTLQSSTPTSLQFSDLDNDSDFDLLTASGSSQYNNQVYNVYKNNGKGQFSLANNTGYNLGRINGFGTLGDFNNDGKTDIISGAADCCVSGDPLRVFFSIKDSLAYTESTTALYRVGNPYYQNMTVIDLDLDKFQDIVFTMITSIGSVYAQTFLNNGNNTFTEKASALGISNSFTPGCCPIPAGVHSTIIDFDNDFKPDIDIHHNNFSANPWHTPNNFQRKNTTRNKSVKIKLDACSGPREGWGARIKYKCGGSWYYQQHNSYSTIARYPFLYLGMKDTNRIDSLVVEWIGGAKTIRTNLSAGNYYVILENTACAIKSNVIYKQPSNVQTSVGQSATLLIKTNPDTAMIQWQRNTGSGWINLSNNSVFSGVSNDTLMIYNTLKSYDGHLFRCVVSIDSCRDTSIVVSLTVQCGIIIRQPSKQAVSLGNTATIIVSSTSSTTTFQWQHNIGSGWSNLSNGGQFNGVTNDSLTISNISLSNKNQRFRCLVTIDSCSEISDSATLFVVPAYLPTNGLVGWWPFNGNAKDESGNGNDGTVNGATLIADRYSKINSAYSFNNLNDYIEVLTKNGNFNSQIYTFSFWTKNNLIDGDAAFISRLQPQSDASNNYDNYCFFASDGKANLNYKGKIGYMYSSANNGKGPDMLGDIWKNITITVSSDSIRSYLNGNLIIKEKFYVGIDFNNNYPIRFGKSNNSYWAEFNGIIDDISYWSRALTLQEIIVLYTNNSCGIGISRQPTNQNKTVGTNAQFSLSAGPSSATFQWQRNTGSGWSNLSNNSTFSGVTNDTLSISSLPRNFDGHLFRCIVSADTCRDTSAVVTLSVDCGLISTKPADKTIFKNSNTTFTLTASPVSTFQWQRNTGSGWSNLSNSSTFSGVNNDTLSITAAPLSANGDQFRCIVSADGCADTSATVTLNVVACASGTVTWDGGGADQSAFTKENMDVDMLPCPTANARFNGTSNKNCIIGDTLEINKFNTTTAYSGRIKMEGKNTIINADDIDLKGTMFTVEDRCGKISCDSFSLTFNGYAETSGLGMDVASLFYVRCSNFAARSNAVMNLNHFYLDRNGSFQAPNSNGVVKCSGNFTRDFASTFNPRTGSWNFIGDKNTNLDPGLGTGSPVRIQFNHLTVAKTNNNTLSITNNDTIQVNGNFVLSGTKGRVQGGILNAKGNITMGKAFQDGAFNRVLLTGTTNQTITCDTANEFSETVVLQKPSGKVLLGKDLSLGSVRFNSGILDPNGKKFILTGNDISGQNIQSNIKDRAYVLKTNGAFSGNSITVPLSKGDGLSLNSISLNTSGTHNDWQLDYVAANPSTLDNDLNSDLASISSTGYWRVQRLSSGAGSAETFLKILAGSGFDRVALLDGGVWRSIGGSVSGSTITSTESSLFATTGDWYITAGVAGAPNAVNHIVVDKDVVSGEEVELSNGSPSSVEGRSMSDANNIVVRHAHYDINCCIHLYPNPAHEYLNIQLPEGAARYTISDMSGRILSSHHASQTKLNLSKFSEGMYLLSTEVNGIQYSVRFVKGD